MRRSSGVSPGSDFELPCELVLLALGFLGPEADTVISRLGCELTERGNVKAGPGLPNEGTGCLGVRGRAAGAVADRVGDLGGT